MKKSFTTYIKSLACLLTVASLSISLSCSKEDSYKIPQDVSNVALISATIDTSIVTTKTQHSYLNKSLKTVWQEGDEIAVAGEKSAVYKFVQKGAILNNGHTTNFLCEESVTLSAGDIIAVYPYTTDFCFNLGSQSGKIEDLSKTDILLARSTVEPSKNIQLNFSPLCAILRFPKGMEVSDNANSGAIEFTLSGDNIANSISISKNDGVTYGKGDIRVSATVSAGKLTEELYICFVPQQTKGKYIYYLASEKGDKFEFLKDGISTSKVYSVNTLSGGFVLFEDANFKKYCVDNFDINKDGEISFAEAKLVERIEVYTTPYGDDIKSLVGIERFVNLTYLRCYGNSSFHRGQLTSLDLSQNKALDTLRCYYNQLTSLDISKCTSLTHLSCEYNQLTSLDVSKCTSLEYLNCENNQLTSLDLSQNKALDTLCCHYNQLTSLDVSKCTSLTFLWCSFNPLTSLDVSKCTSLTYLNCIDNQLTSLDISKCTSLTSLSCSNNQLTSLDVSKCTVLTTLHCMSNQLTSLDVSKLTSLTFLHCMSNQLTSLDVSKLTSLTFLNCSNNQLTSLDISNNIALERFNCYNNSLISLDVSKNTILYSLYAWPQTGTLQSLIKKKGQIITYGYLVEIGIKFIDNPADYGTTIIEVE